MDCGYRWYRKAKCVWLRVRPTRSGTPAKDDELTSLRDDPTHVTRTRTVGTGCTGTRGLPAGNHGGLFFSREPAEWTSLEGGTLWWGGADGERSETPRVDKERTLKDPSVWTALT